MNNIQIGFIPLILFCFLRPFALINTNIVIGGLNVFELFAIIISYMLLFVTALNIRKIKFDLISIFILWFCSYCLISIFWGSQARIIAQVTFPFALFFAVRLIISEPKQIKLLITVLIISYCFLLFVSLYQIIQETTIFKVETITGIERHAGMFKSLKPFSYAMFFFSVLFYIKVIIYQLKNRQIKWALLFLLIVSFFCIFKTYVRTTFIGLTIFWAISLWGYNKKYFSIVLIISLIMGVLYFSTFQQIFFKTQEFDINIASSGRDYLWRNNVNAFLASSFDRKILGYGFGVASIGLIGSDPEILPSHNDYLQILMSLGTVGLVLYLFIFLVLLKDVYMSSIDKNIKFFYYGIIFSIILMNFVSGVTLFQVGISQLFWMVMGFFYVFRDFNVTSSTVSEF